MRQYLSLYEVFGFISFILIGVGVLSFVDNTTRPPGMYQTYEFRRGASDTTKQPDINQNNEFQGSAPVVIGGKPVGKPFRVGTETEQLERSRSLGIVLIISGIASGLVAVYMLYDQKKRTKE